MRLKILFFCVVTIVTVGFGPDRQRVRAETEAPAQNSTSAAKGVSSTENGPAPSPINSQNRTANETGSGKNDTSPRPAGNSKPTGVLGFIRDKNGAALMRAFYVILGVTAIVIVYFVVRSVRLRRKRSKSRKYGIIAKKGDLEMTPLDQDDDDEDMTVFEAQNRTRK